jgi:hypothetical protein
LFAGSDWSLYWLREESQEQENGLFPNSDKLFFRQKMMEAAMQAAEAAMQEAAARDIQQRQANGIADNGSSAMGRMAQQAAEQHLMDLEASQATLPMDTVGEFAHVQQQLHLLQALQVAEMGEYGGGGSGMPPHVVQEMNLLGIDINDAESVQALLQIMAQQEQESTRPKEHYLTIAQNGTLSV